MGQEQQVMYRFCRMELAQFALFDENYSAELNDVQYKTEVQFSFDKDLSMLCSKIIINETQNEKPLLKAELNSFFDIKKESLDLLQQDERIVFPPMLLVQFASLCYGSMRGVIYAKTMSTPLCNFILPPVYFANIINKGFEVEE
ncbi:MAG: hypothetical protein IJ626_00105 [Muribaculaceae bacterium]|nr:hypothetical protein [Muribaculaceae bacterium]